MKFFIAFVLILVASSKIKACDCNPPKEILEFYSAEYVFYGEIISKDYPKDSLTYTLTFRVDKHYKNGEQPKFLRFTHPSEGRYIGVFTSCDEHQNVGEKWLVFAKTYQNRLVFSSMCSNSRSYLTKEMIELLKTANEFKLGSHFFNYDFSNLFTYEKPSYNLDSALKKVNSKKFKPDQGVAIMLDIDTNSNILKRNIYDNPFTRIDKSTKWGLYQVINEKPNRLLNDFEKRMLKFSKKIKNWPVTYFKPTNEKVNTRKYLTFRIDKKGNLVWSNMVMGIN